jgi:hypothetical protein
MIKICDYPCENRREAEQEEDKNMTELKASMNMIRASRTKQQYYEDNKEKLQERMKEYRESNKERIKEYCEDNKQKIQENMKEYREKKKPKYKITIKNIMKPTKPQY